MVKALGYTIIQDGRKKKYQGNGYKNSRQFHQNFYTKKKQLNLQLIIRFILIKKIEILYFIYLY